MSNRSAFKEKPKSVTKKMNLIQVDSIQPNHSQAEEIAQLLALAFENGSGLSKICRAEGEELRRRLRLLFLAGSVMQATANQPVLCIFKDAKPISVAVFQEPGSHLPLWAQVRWLLQVSLGISSSVAWRIWQNLRILKRHHPLESHYYLTLLGIHPNFQGKGYARALLDTVHARSEAHLLSKGVYLETANPRNVPFYEHFGYYITAQLEIKGVQTFTMYRPNQQK